MARNCCNTPVVVVTCPSDCPEVQSIELANVNLSGIGVLDSWDGTTGNFRGVASANAMLVITLDNTNHNALFMLSASAIAAALPNASETVRGILETATDAEAIGKLATDKILVPSNLAAIPSSTTFAGLLELATQAEVDAGTDPLLAVSPSTLAGRDFISAANNAVTTMTGPASLDCAGTYFFTIQSTGNFGGLLLSECALDFSNVAFSFATVPMDANNLLGTDGAGLATPIAIDTFLSSQNTSSWGAPTGILTRTTFAGIAPLTFSNPPTQSECNAAGIQISILSQRLAAIITDLKGLLVPTW